MTQGFPEDFHTGAYDSPDKGDSNDAANFAAHNYSSLPTAALIEGCTFSVDYSVPELSVASGTVRLTDTDVEGVKHEWSDGAFVYEIDAQTVSLTDGDVNHVYVEADRTTNDTASVVVNTTGSQPSEASLKVGEVDTTNDTKSEQWSLLAPDGTLTFPSKSTASSAASSLADGAVVYSRSDEKHYAVVASALKPLGAFTDSDGDGVYQLPSDTDGIDVASVSSDTLEAQNSATSEIEVANLKQTQMMMRRNS